MHIHVGGGEGEAAASQVHVARAAESDQEGARNGERRQGRDRRQVPRKTQGLLPRLHVDVSYVIVFD